MKKFLIGQLASFGDCLYATTVAKQIKYDFPDAHITWAIATRYKSILHLNPYVDHIWDVPLINNDYYDIGWKNFEAEALKRKAEGLYDELVFTQLAQKHWNKYDGTIRSSTLRGYKRPITVSVDPVIRLSGEEVGNVAEFAKRNSLGDFKQVILFEYSPASGQSFIDEDFALQVARKITSLNKDVCFVFSGPRALSYAGSQIIDASSLTYRENAELTRYCTLLIGCSSGITWLSTSDWAKKLQTVQLLNRNYDFFAGVKYDYEYWKLPAADVIEITVKDLDKVTGCISTILHDNFASAKLSYDELYRPGYFNFRKVLLIVLGMYNNKPGAVFSVISGYHTRNKHLKLTMLYYYAFIELKKIYSLKMRSSFKKIFYKLMLN